MIFTRAAAELNISPSALSQTIRRLETRLGLRLLVRSTRSVALTAAGERMFSAVSDGLGTIRREIDALSSQSGTATGALRITRSEYATLMVLEPAMRDFLPAHPGISVEFVIDNGLSDIVDEKFDAGIRPAIAGIRRKGGGIVTLPSQDMPDLPRAVELAIGIPGRVDLDAQGRIRLRPSRGPVRMAPSMVQH